jgi:hypothetical protein
MSALQSVEGSQGFPRESASWVRGSVATAALGEMTMSDEVAVHEAPVWRDRANFIISANIRKEDLPRSWEQLWARQIDENRFEVCCIPFFSYDLALGDEVETGPEDGKRFVIQRLVKASGRYTFRVWFGDSKDPGIRTEVISKLRELDLLVEWSSQNLLAIDAPDSESAQRIADYLNKEHQSKRLIYETGRTQPRN